MSISFKKKHTHITLGVILFFVILLIGGNYWVRHNIENIIQNLVNRESGGKYRLEIQKIKYHNKLQRFEALNTHLFLMDTLRQENRTDVKIPYLEFRLKSVWDVIFHKKLVLDSVICKAPTFNIHPALKDTTENISVPEQLGEIYLQIEKAMQNMQVKKLRFTNSNINLFTPGGSKRVIRLHNIDFGIDGFAVNAQKSNTNQFFFSENIFVHSGQQSFIFPDGIHELTFSSLSISTDHQIIALNNCTLNGTSPDSSSAIYKVHFDTLKLINTDFMALYRKSLIKVDSVYCRGSDFDFAFNNSKKRKKISPNTFINSVLQNLFGDIQIKYIGIINSNISVQSKREDKTISFVTKGNNFTLKEIKVAAHEEEPVQVGSINFDVKNYVSFTDDSLYKISFDSVALTNRQLKLVNFSLLPGVKNKDHALRKLAIPGLTLKGLSLGDLIFDKKIKMDEALLQNPSLIIESKGKNENKIRKPLFDVFDDIEKYFAIQQLSISKGQVKYFFSDADNHTLEFESVDAAVFLKDLLRATQVNNVEASIDRLSFSNAIYNNGLQRILLANGFLDGNQKNFYIQGIDYKDKNELLHLKANGLVLADISMSDYLDDESIHLEQFSWANGQISTQRMTENKIPGKSNLPVSIHINNISLPNTALQLNMAGSLQLQTFLNQFHIENFVKPSEEALHFDQAYFNGGSFMILSPGLSIFTDSFNVNNLNTSLIENVSIRYHTDRDSLIILIPELSGNPAITNFTNIKHWNGFHLKKPDIQWFSRQKIGENPVKNNTVRMPVYFEDLRVDSAQGHFTSIKDDTTEISLPQLSFRLHHATFNDSILLGGLNGSLQGFQFTAPKGSSVISPPANFTFQVDSLYFLPDKKFKIQTGPLHFTSPQVLISGRKDFSLQQAQLDIPQLSLDEKNINNWEDVFFNHTNSSLGLSTFLNNKQGKFDFQGIHFFTADSTLLLDSFAFIPHDSSNTFFSKQKWQKDYLEFKTGKMIWNKIDAARLFAKEFSISAQSLTIQDAWIHAVKDQKLPVNLQVTKPLPVELLSKIEFPLDIRTIRLLNSHIQYEEIPGMVQPGLILNISPLNAEVNHVQNKSFNIYDSLDISGHGRINDMVDASIRMKQSYNDTSGGFHIEMSISPFAANTINPLQQAITKVQIIKGQVDTLHISANANNNAAFGNIQIHTKGLAIRAYHENADVKTPLLTKAKYLMANLFILKKDKTRTADFSVNRKKEKSVFNFWIKIMLAGLKSAAGIKSN